ncbi:NAD(P)/FAD-dependent oxidoreductase [Sphingomonas sp. KR1UV-12]|uniref:NAD(P)/FAD-dependent oxidoreductase n=1 Tax=Sphingomonas aurea TaxID=3063994 RepID=A0ABT9EKY3_9SPHN|nr:NAD(P)/FAD-dependent oxidoreductase [Sphingomonas sp. KR1UV-12]MDP1027624.1 NAD(P)/FAD-dependent oxidoreductase [Sphingomonas sp. KR1UV-12]
MSEIGELVSAGRGETVRLDAVVVGAGFGGMYAVHRLRERGMRIVGIEAGGDVGGVWYWNRYPGARCDLMCVDYSYSFSPEIEQEWTWSEQFAAQPEILAYANFVADKLKLRDSIRFNTRVTGAVWDEDRQLWSVTVDDGTVYEASYCVLATGPLSIPKDPEIPGLADFGGELYRAQKWPHHEVDFSTKRVGLIGTGSTGIQIVTEVAKDVGEFYVFQRTPSFTLPMRNDKLDPDYVEEIKAHYAGLRAAANASALGGVRPSTTRPYFSLPPRQRRQLMEDAWRMGGHAFLGTFSDLLTNPDANEQVAEFVRAKIGEVVNDPETAEALKPKGYPIFARRPCLDTDYYEMFNRPNVHLVDLLKDPIAEITPTGVRLAGGTEVALDALILATGYDGLTGAMMAFDIVGRDGANLRDKWSHGAESYLGLMLAGFPNLFMVCGANGPAALANIISINEQNVNWLCALLDHMEAEGLGTFEPTPQAEARWMDLVHTLAEKTLLSKAQTWYVGANVTGKTRGLTMFTGGFSKYCEHCATAAAGGYSELVFRPAVSLVEA